MGNNKPTFKRNLLAAAIAAAGVAGFSGQALAAEICVSGDDCLAGTTSSGVDITGNVISPSAYGDIALEADGHVIINADSNDGGYGDFIVTDYDAYNTYSRQEVIRANIETTTLSSDNVVVTNDLTVNGTIYGDLTGNVTGDVTGELYAGGGKYNGGTSVIGEGVITINDYGSAFVLPNFVGAGDKYGNYANISSAGLTTNGDVNATNGDFTGNVQVDGVLTVGNTVTITTDSIDVDGGTFIDTTSVTTEQLNATTAVTTPQVNGLEGLYGAADGNALVISDPDGVEIDAELSLTDGLFVSDNASYGAGPGFSATATVPLGETDTDWDTHGELDGLTIGNNLLNEEGTYELTEVTTLQDDDDLVNELQLNENGYRLTTARSRHLETNTDVRTAVVDATSVTNTIADTVNEQIHEEDSVEQTQDESGFVLQAASVRSHTIDGVDQYTPTDYDGTLDFAADGTEISHRDNVANESGQLWVGTDEASLTVTNDEGNTHGLVVGTSSTTLSGGTTSTYLTLDDDGATFSDDEGGPVRVTGVAAGTTTYDAVNFGQFESFQSDVNSQLSGLKGDINDLEDDLSTGIAIANAMEVLLPDPGKKFRLNVGGGFYNGESAIGLTGAGRVGENGTAVYFGLGGGVDGSEMGGKAGVSFQW